MKMKVDFENCAWRIYGASPRSGPCNLCPKVIIISFWKNNNLYIRI